MRFRFFAAAAVAAALGASIPATARGYGVATHAWLSDEAARRLAAADPALAFLATDPDAHACFLYGAVFPDMRSTARQAATYDLIRQKLLQISGVDGVRFSTAEVATSFAQFNTHGGDFVLSLVDRARASGDRYRLAFALGNLAHVLEDKYAQVFHLPTETQRRLAGDIGVEPMADPAAVAHWHPGNENEIVFEAMGDFVRPLWVLEFLKGVRARLAAQAPDSERRAADLRGFYWQAADAYCRGAGLTPPTRTGIENGATLFEVAMTFYPFFTTNESAADAMRTFVDRYVQLSWWAQLATGIVQQITTNLTGGADLFDVIGPILVPTVGGQVGGRSPLSEIIFAFGQGGTAEANVRAKYAANPEFVRLAASGFLDRATYAAMRYDVAYELVLDGCTRLAASRFTDDRLWPTFAHDAMIAAGTRSLLQASGADGVARAPGLLVFAVRYEDEATGGPIPLVALPGDIGRRLWTTVELFGSEDGAIARIVRVRLRADVGAGAADPVVAERSAIVPAAALEPGGYGSAPRPSVAVSWTIADVPGARSLYVEVDERRVAPGPDGDQADALFATSTRRIAALVQGRPHYAAWYGKLGGAMGPLEVRR